ncbi:hypothetical protein NDI85_16340 [Halomicroarcula sp. S1AR25-4]|uniref:hypothetical protein n=1 Tax=Haloarcula sp. S1AR25-4 TaxID=2950538 RepID=UPI00287574DA|nr:hypothetical protein [Halomicroarcula sp. S1AR25-4]MDS0279371.1 hypothetical protein [Halomicroarcula sp. S1AR25-4]
MLKKALEPVKTILSKLKHQIRYRSRAFPSFIDEYKNSWIYWSSSFAGGLFGVLSQPSWRPISTIVVVAVFILPSIGYYWKNQPFGLFCTYRSIDHGSQKPAVGEESNEIATPSGDGFEIDIEIGTKERINNVDLQINTPDEAPIDFVDECGSWDEFDYDSCVYTAQDVGDEQWAVAIYLENLGLNSHCDNYCEIVDLNSGKEVLSVALHE